jgi:hypothetical protein
MFDCHTDDAACPSNGKINAMVVGDGVVGGKRRDGRWKIHVIDFNSAPFYLKYNIFKEEDIYFKHRENKYSITTYFGQLMSPALEMTEFVPLTERYAMWAENMSITEKEHTLDPKSPQIVFDFPINDYEFAFICSDGVESFYHPVRNELQKSNEPIFVLDALRVLLDFPNRPGFARIQRNWVFKQDRKGTFIRRNWKNGDDVSVGAIHNEEIAIFGSACDPISNHHLRLGELVTMKTGMPVWIMPCLASPIQQGRGWLILFIAGP